MFCLGTASIEDAGAPRVLCDLSAMSRRCGCVPLPKLHGESAAATLLLHIVTCYYILVSPGGVAASARCRWAQAWRVRQHGYDPMEVEAVRG